MKPDVGTMIGVTLLVLVASALVGAGLYALFGQPATDDGRRRKQHVIKGFQVGGGIVLGFILMGSLVACSQIAFGIVESTRLSRIAAFFIALVSVAFIFGTIAHWAKYFPGWLAYSVLSGLLMAGSGHLVNNPSILVPRWWSVSATILISVGALASTRFKNHALSAIDKAALMTWLLAFVFSIGVESTHASYREPLGLGAMFGGTLALVGAWWYHRRAHHHRKFIATTGPSGQRSRS
jgi:hypothetical protein